MLSFNLLPPEEKNRLQLKKQTRVAIIWSGSVFLALAFFTLLLLPSYFRSSFQEKEVLRNLRLTEESPLVTRMATIRQSIATLKQSAADIARGTKVASIFSGIISDFISALPTGITPTALTFNSQKQEMKVLGFAATRNALVALQGSLRARKNISNISIPLSDLVQDTDIPFTLTFTLLP